MSEKIIILGGLGTGSVIAAAIHHANLKGYHNSTVVGYLNDRLEEGLSLEGFPVLGKLSDVQKYIDLGYLFIYTI